MTQKHDQSSNNSVSLYNITNSAQQTENPEPETTQTTVIQSTMDKTALKAEQLTHILDASSIPSSTRRIKPLNNFLGQDRAKASVEAGIALPYSGYNIFAVGTAGLGKRTMIKRLLQQHAKTMQTPHDWVYVNNFKNARQPIALQFLAGRA